MVNRMDKELRDYVEDFARIHEARGLTRTKGRILSYLTVSNPVIQSLDDICQALDLAKSTVSPELKQLVDLGLVTRLKKKDFANIEGTKGYLFQVTKDQWVSAVDDKGAASTLFIAMADRGLKLLESKDFLIKERLLEMRLLFDFMRKNMPYLMQRYREYRESIDLEEYESTF